MNTEDMISQCVRGGLAKDMLEELEQEVPSVHLVVKKMREDIGNNSVRVRVDQNLVKIDFQGVNEDTRRDMNVIIDTYSRIYPEFEFVISAPSASL